MIDFTNMSPEEVLEALNLDAPTLAGFVDFARNTFPPVEGWTEPETDPGIAVELREKAP